MRQVRKLNENVNSIQVSFTAYLDNDDVKRAYVYLNSKRRGYQTEYLCQAYQTYNAFKDVPTQALTMLSNINALKYISEKYGITSKSEEKVKTILENVNFEKPPVQYDVKHGKKSLQFDMRVPIQKELHDYLLPLGNKKQVFAITEFLNTYLSLGVDKEYADYEAEEMLKSIAALYKYSEDDETIKKIIKVLFIPVNIEHVPEYNEKQKSIDEIRQDIATLLLDDK